MLAMVYHHYEVSNEVNPLYLLHLILLLFLCFYLDLIATENQNQTSFLNYIRINFDNLTTKTYGL
jgi:hypothetical protein